MMRTLLPGVFRGTLLTIMWVLVLLTVALGHSTVSLVTLWRIVGVGWLAGILFGGGYPYVWNYAAWPAPLSIVVATGVNVLVGYGSLWLLLPDLFIQFQPWWWAVTALTLAGHVVGFYFYQKWQNQRLARQLNQRSKSRYN